MMKVNYRDDDDLAILPGVGLQLGAGAHHPGQVVDGVLVGWG